MSTLPCVFNPPVWGAPNADTTKYAYYTTGGHRNLNTVTLSGGWVTTHKYDTRGRLVFVQHPVAPQDSLDLGIMNQVVYQRQRTLQGSLVTTTFQYDSLFNVVQVTDPKGQVYKYRYNALGWLIRQEDLSFSAALEGTCPNTLPFLRSLRSRPPGWR